QYVILEVPEQNKMKMPHASPWMPRLLSQLPILAFRLAPARLRAGGTRWWAGLICLLVFPFWLAAQSTALLTGTLTDPTGAAVPQAEVTCRNSETGLTYHALTTIEGLFRFPDLPIGIYDVSVARTGFSPLSNRGITLVTGHSVDLRLQLQLG